MLLKNNTLSGNNIAIFFFVLFAVFGANAQVYRHNFGTTTITANPYTGSPTLMNSGLSGSSWTNNTGPWLNTNGESNSVALGATSPQGSTTSLTQFILTFNVASGKQLNITSFSFWRRRSPSAAQTWNMTVNGIPVGSGTTPPTGASTGTVPVNTPITGLTGTVTVSINFNNNLNGSGSLTVDNFTLNGTVTNAMVPLCPIDITSFSPATGPVNTLVTITGSGFNDATNVTFDGIEATFAQLSDTEIIALVPAGASNGTIVVTGPGCNDTAPSDFTVLSSECDGEIYISELYDHNSGSYGVIELYNPSGNTVVLGNQYILERYGNIGDPLPSGGYITVLAGSIPPYSTYLVSSSTSAPPTCPTSFSDNLGNGINANDEFKLKKNGALIDVARAPNYIGYTVKRKPDAIAPTPTYNSADWTVNSNTCADLGSHTANATGGGPTPNITHPASQYICENASATFSVSVAGTSYTYQWKVLNNSGNWVNVVNGPNYSGATSSTLNVISAPFSFDGNQYYCEITSSTCDLISNAAQLNITAAPQTPVATVTPSGCTANTGSITVTSPIDFGMSYSINGTSYQFGTTFSNLAPGTYNITAKTLSGCVSAPATVVIGTGGSPDIATTNVVQPDCTNNTGTITVEAPVGTGYTYSIFGNDFQTSPVFTVVAGTYNVTVKNALGCTSVTPDIVINPPLGTPAVATTTVTQPDCNQPNGIIEVTTPTGAGFTYSINGTDFQAGTTFNPVPGTYTITVQNADGCTSQTGTITIDPAPTVPAVATTTVTQPTCTEPNGSIEVTSPMGTGLEYSINGVDFQTGTIFNNVSSGTYTITVQNSDGCTSESAPVVIDAAPTSPAVATTILTQPSCTESNGSIEVTSPVGSDFTYSINGTNFQAGTTFNNVTPGTYTITVQNAESCTSESVPVVIDAAPTSPAVATTIITQPSCTESNGTIEVSAPTGNGFTYSINGIDFQAGTTFSNVTTGNYTITVQNSDGCTSESAPVVIDPVPASPAVATTAITQPTCTEPNGSIEVTSPVGTDFTYSINGMDFQTGTTFSNIASGNYTITVQNLDGCTSQSAPVVIDPAPASPAVATTILTQPTCTEPNGTIEVTSPVGTDFTYSINGMDFQTGTTFSNIASGNYTITVQNSDGCTSESAPVVIDPVPASPAVATTAITQPTCTEPNGSIEVTSPVGTDFTYSINGTDFQAGTTFNNVSSGTYTIITQNSDGCTSESTPVVIDAAPTGPAVATTTVTQPDCTQPNGTIEITSPVGTGLEYSINGVDFQAGTFFSNIASGNYTITVQNAEGCTSESASIVIDNAPAGPAVATTIVTQPTCTEPNGTIEVTSPTGTGLEYSINGIDFQTGTTFSNIASGNYTITVQNAEGCTSESAPVVIDAAPTGPAVATTTVTQPDCTQPNATIEVTSPTGTGLEYSINGIDFQTGTTFSNVASGTYTITVQNAEGCTSETGQITINPAPAIPADSDITVTQPGCNTLGNITVNAPTGTGLTYSKDGVTYQSGNVFNSLPAGTYYISVKNAAGCISENPQTVVINTPPAVPATATFTKTNPTCDIPTGSITINSPTGAGLQYSIDNGANFSSGTTFSNLAPGSYQIVVINADGCTSAPVNVTINPIPDVPDDPTVSLTQPGCNATAGSVTITAPVQAGYTYSIDGVTYQSSALFTNIAPGSYFAYVKNAAGCVSDNPAPFVINNAPPVPATATTVTTNPDCSIASGSIEITAPSGTGYTYSIDNNNYQAGTTFDNLPPGNYTITVQNAEGCTSLPVSRTIQPQPAVPPVPTATILQPDCDTDTGKLVVSNPIGAGYSFSLDGGITYQVNATFPSLAPGDYTLTVKNAAGCTESTDITINNPPTPAPDPGTITGTGELCIDETAQLTSTEPDGIWSSSNTNAVIVDDAGLVTAIAPGIATISYTVGTECTAAAVMTVRVYPFPDPSLAEQYYICEDNATETFSTVTLFSGLSSGNHTFIWKKGEEIINTTSSSITVSEPGEYSVEAINTTTGCIGYASTTVTVSSQAVAVATVATDFNYRQTITVNVIGGSGDYEFSLNNGPYQDDNIFTGVTEGLYTITINDKNGCNPLVLEVYVLDYPRFFSPNGDGQHDRWNIKGLSNQDKAIIYIFDRYGKIVSVIRPGEMGWDGTYNGEILPATDYWFTLLYQSSDGNNKEFKAHFSMLR